MQQQARPSSSQRCEGSMTRPRTADPNEKSFEAGSKPGNMAVRHDSIRVRLNKLHDMLVKLESMRAGGEETYRSDDILRAAGE